MSGEKQREVKIQQPLSPKRIVSLPMNKVEKKRTKRKLKILHLHSKIFMKNSPLIKVPKKLSTLKTLFS